MQLYAPLIGIVTAPVSYESIDTPNSGTSDNAVHNEEILKARRTVWL